MTRDRAWLRTIILARGLSRRWRGLAGVSRHTLHPDSEAQRREVLEVLRELVADAVPPPAAEAIARACIATLAAARSGGLLLSGEAVWVEEHRA